ncbi:MAG: phage antirepressor KilAC domain-containing protein [Prevotella sp.]|jgi:prophage antirepressor-like protein|nr:phage antirepressor KilAC domain-containing protein [Prevotella sp.]
MDNSLMSFSFEGNSFRTINREGNVLFCLVDLCNILGLDNVSRVKSRLRQDGVTQSKGVVKTGKRADGSIYEQEGVLYFIDESNFYKTILQSRKPVAEPFTDYVCRKVLPSIRKTGGYSVDTGNENNLDLFARALVAAQEHINLCNSQNEKLEKELQQKDTHTKKLEEIIQEATPKIEYTDTVLKSVDTYTTSFVAKELGFKNARELNTTLKNAGVIYRQSDRWMLRTKYCSKYYTKTKTFPYMDGLTGEQRTNVYMVWTEKGRKFLHEFFGKTQNLS